MIESIYVNKLCCGNPFRLGEEKLKFLSKTFVGHMAEFTVIGRKYMGKDLVGSDGGGVGTFGTRGQTKDFGSEKNLLFFCSKKKSSGCF